MDLKLNLDEYENIIIYKSLTSSDYLSKIIDHVKPIYFRDKNIRSIFQIIVSFYEKRNVAPTVSEIKTYLVSEEIRESFKTVVRSFTNIDKNLNQDELLHNTERYIKERAIYCSMLDIADDITSGKIDTSVILDKFEKCCNVSLKTDRGLDLIKDIDFLIRDLNVEQPTISSKWKWLDNKLDGGFLLNGRGLYCIAGETNIGKSIVLGNIATNIALQGKTVLLITLEMSELMYAKRLASNITSIPIRDLKSETQTLKQQIDQISQTKSRILIKEFPPSTITVNDIQSYVKELISQKIKIDTIIVDYVNLIHSPLGTNSYERIKYAAEKLRALSYIFSCPIITATQLNREGYGVNNPGLTTISESMGLAATADVIVGIFQDDEDKELGIIRFGMMKNRFGAKFGTTAMKLDYNTLTITEDETLNSEDNQADTTKALLALSTGS